MRLYLIAYAGVALAMCALDFVWLAFVAPTFYQAYIGPLLLPQPNLVPALVFYVLYVVGLVTFCVMPALTAASWRKAALLGALFGLVAYGTYDLSNLATLKGWSIEVTLVDMVWGSLLSAGTCCCGYFWSRFFSRR